MTARFDGEDAIVLSNNVDSVCNLTCVVELNDTGRNYFTLLLRTIGVLEAGERRGGVVVYDAPES
jgi:hypothetical protein